MFHFFTQKGKSARGSSNDHCWLVNREPLVGSGLVLRLIPQSISSQEMTLNACVCSVQGQRNGVQICRGTEKHREVLWHGNNLWDWKHGIWQLLYPRSWTVAFTRLPIYLLLHMLAWKEFYWRKLTCLQRKQSSKHHFWGDIRQVFGEYLWLRQVWQSAEAYIWVFFFLFHWPEISVKFPKINPHLHTTEFATNTHCIMPFTQLTSMVSIHI